MQVVFGCIDWFVVYFEVLLCDGLESCMVEFVGWFNVSCYDVSFDLLLCVVIVYFWFIILYLFDDGNGCFVCVLIDLVLVQGELQSICFYVMLVVIFVDCKGYYQ